MGDATKCPKCGRISVVWDPVRLEFRCLWNDCRYKKPKGEAG